MQPSEVAPRDTRPLWVAAAITVFVILVTMAWALSPASSPTVIPASAPFMTSISAPGMGDLRAAEAPVLTSVGMGDLRRLEGGVTATTGEAQPVGMGDVRADRLPSGVYRTAPYTGMGDVHAVEEDVRQ